jgi:hypothetical protein
MPHTHRLSDRLGALAGVAFALLIFLSVAMIDPLRRATDQELLAWWADGGLLRDSVVSMHLKLGGMACFLVFLAQLRARLRAADPENPWLDLVYGAGITFVATFSLSAIARPLIAQAVRSGGEPLPGPDTLRYATEFTQVAFGVVAIPFATLTVAAASLVILQTGALSRLVGWLGLVVAALCVIMIALQAGPWATPLILIWTTGASTQLFRGRGARVASADASPGMAQRQPQGLVSQP